jgi:hypothetical protein
MGLPHGRGDALAPLAIEVTEPAIAVAVRMLGPVLLPQQHQRHAAPTQLGVDAAPIRLRPRQPLVEPRRREQKPLQLGIVELDRPGDADHRGTPQILADRRAPDPKRLRDQPLARPAGMLQTKYFSNLAHRQSLGRHPIPSLSLRRHGSRGQIANLESKYPCSGVAGGGPLRSESVAAFRRNQWPASVGITGRLASEFAD